MLACGRKRITTSVCARRMAKRPWQIGIWQIGIWQTGSYGESTMANWHMANWNMASYQKFSLLSLNFSVGSNKISSDRVKKYPDHVSASYLQCIKSMLGPGQGPSLQHTKGLCESWNLLKCQFSCYLFADLNFNFEKRLGHKIITKTCLFSVYLYFLFSSILSLSQQSQITFY